jgi:two-component system, LytTR family, response regulator
MQIRTIIVEDEKPSLDRLKDLLEDFPEISVVGTAENGQAAIELINKIKPDLAFLDIHLPVCSSFEVLNRVEIIPQTIFITAFDQYAVEAFEKNAIDYLLKPTTKERLAQAIEKVKKTNFPIDENLLKILRSTVENKKTPKRFCVKQKSEILFIPVDDVYYFKAEDKYVFLNTFNKEYIYDSTLKELEKELNDRKFIRVHKSLIVSPDKIQKIKKQFSGKFSIILNDEKRSQLEIGRTYLQGVKEKLNF